MTGSIQYLPLILLAVVLNTGAQVVLKTGLQNIGHFEFTVGNAVPVFLKMIVSPYIISGISFYVFSLVVWLMTLSRVEVSFAYPMSALGYVLTATVGYFLFNENVTLTRIIGIVVIMVGVCLVARSST